MDGFQCWVWYRDQWSVWSKRSLVGGTVAGVVWLGVLMNRLCGQFWVEVGSLNLIWVYILCDFFSSLYVFVLGLILMICLGLIWSVVGIIICRVHLNLKWVGDPWRSLAEGAIEHCCWVTGRDFKSLDFFIFGLGMTHQHLFIFYQ